MSLHRNKDMSESICSFMVFILVGFCRVLWVFVFVFLLEEHIRKALVVFILHFK